MNEWVQWINEYIEFISHEPMNQWNSDSVNPWASESITSRTAQDRAEISKKGHL